MKSNRPSPDVTKQPSPRKSNQSSPNKTKPTPSASPSKNNKRNIPSNTPSGGKDVSVDNPVKSGEDVISSKSCVDIVEEDKPLQFTELPSLDDDGDEMQSAGEVKHIVSEIPDDECFD